MKCKNHSIFIETPRLVFSLKVSYLSSEDDTRKLLKYRNDLDNKIKTLETEIDNLKKAISVLDTQIVRQGFKKPEIKKK